MNQRAAASVLPFLLAGCATTPAPMTPDAHVEEELRQERAHDREVEARTADINRVLLNLDKAMDTYSGIVARSGEARDTATQKSLERYLISTSKTYFDQLLRIAENDSDPTDRARALAAIGFSARREALDTLLNGLRAEDDTVVTDAAFGLSELRDERTPLDRLGQIVLDGDRPMWVRQKVAGSLLQVQDAVHDPRQVLPVWEAVLQAPKGAYDPFVVMYALKGVGQLRDAKLAPLVEPYTKDPTPVVRYAAAIALGMLGNVPSHQALIGLLEPEETNPNVRLAARKALQALAGGVDRGYDAEAWRRVFELGY